jgi:hypothetical protein
MLKRKLAVLGFFAGGLLSTYVLLPALGMFR